MKMKIIIPSLVISSLVISHSVWAMGGRPPAKEEPKYKLEILKMEVITSPTPSAEATSEANQ